MKGVRSMAFRAKDGGMVAEVMNSSPQPHAVTLKWKGESLRLNLPAMSITSAVWR
jgi:O-glycosyl hydrolase